MFDVEIVKKNFPLRQILYLENFWSKTESKTVQDKVGLGKFSPPIFFFFLQKAL